MHYCTLKNHVENVYSTIKKVSMNVNKVGLTVGLVCILLGTTVSVLGIWGYIGDSGLVWRALSTLGVVLLGVILAVAINNMTTGKDK